MENCRHDLVYRHLDRHDYAVVRHDYAVVPYAMTGSHGLPYAMTSSHGLHSDCGQCFPWFECQNCGDEVEYFDFSAEKSKVLANSSNLQNQDGGDWGLPGFVTRRVK